ncbi:retinal homeobox protein Rx2-like [Haliotis asinina]|uniref:retinal homeobox protein Rx2-like n=1 Tax=Haliotis asinina TaxID=109174 RepID=UPI00353200C2
MAQIQPPARCLFPEYTGTSTEIRPLPVKPRVPFSIGDIMKPVITHKHDSVHSGNVKNAKSSQSETVITNTTANPSDEVHERDQINPAWTGRGLQLEHLLRHQKLDSPRTSYIPFTTFLDRASSRNSQGSCDNPPVALPLSLHHLQYCPEPPFPSIRPEAPSTSIRSQNQLRTSPLTHTINRKNDSSPSSDVCDDLIDVESTSPNGSTASSGFYSNPSPTPSSDSSSTSGRTSPPSTNREECIPKRRFSNSQEEDHVSTNPRKNYSEKQVRRLKQVFLENKYPDIELYEDLSRELNIPVQRLKVWFQNRRARNKRASDSRIMAFPPHQQNMAAMLSSAPGYGFMPPMMHQPLYQYPAHHVPMMYPPSLYPGYPYPFHYQQ